MYPFVLEAAETDELVATALALARRAGHNPGYREWRNLVGPYTRALDTSSVGVYGPIGITTGARTPGKVTFGGGQLRNHLIEEHGILPKEAADLVAVHYMDHLFAAGARGENEDPEKCIPHLYALPLPVPHDHPEGDQGKQAA